MRRAAVLLVAGALLVAAAACASDPTGEGFELTAEQLSRHPPADQRSPWEVEVATARPEVPAVVVRRDAPPGVEAGPSPVSPASAGAGLTPIPSATLNWGSAEVEGGWSFTNPTVIGSPLVFLVVENQGDWLRVMAPTRPNQQSGWIDADHVTLSTHEWNVEIDVSENVLRVWEGAELRIETATVDGRATTPTPLGRFYVNETQPQSPTGVYGSWIISTNGFSDSLERFSGEVPIFAIHGTNRPETMGQDLSNGCVRVPNDVVEFIAAHVPAGTPVDISA